MQYIQAKQILHPVKATNDYIHRDYNMNIYRGCCHGCIYCDSRSACYHLENFEKIQAKEHVALMLHKELGQKRKKGIIGTGAMSDPYNPFEQSLELTRTALRLINEHRFGVSITTKSPLITRDIDILKQISQHSPVDVRMTITTADDTLSKIIEPQVAPSSERFDALSRLADAGLFCGIMIMPTLPFITDTEENITQIVKQGIAAGVGNIVFMPGMTLRTGNREYYYQMLDAHFSGLKTTYRETFGERYECLSPNASFLRKRFVDLCRENQILYTFPAINKKLKQLYSKPLSLFDFE